MYDIQRSEIIFLLNPFKKGKCTHMHSYALESGIMGLGGTVVSSSWSSGSSAGPFTYSRMASSLMASLASTPMSHSSHYFTSSVGTSPRDSLISWTSVSWTSSSRVSLCSSTLEKHSINVDLTHDSPLVAY